jgi:hypothetical protein
VSGNVLVTGPVEDTTSYRYLFSNSIYF